MDLMEKIRDENVIIVANKSDLKNSFDEKEILKVFPDHKIQWISALHKKGIDELQTAIVENVWHGNNMDSQGIFISNMRHIGSLKSCREMLEKAVKGIDEKVSLEFISEEIKTAVNYFG